MDSLKLLLVFVIIVVALRMKVAVGLTLLGAGLVLALLYRVPMAEVAGAYRDLALSYRFITLTALVMIITALGALLKELGYLERLVAACRGLPGGERTAAVTLPALVGLMPMPGGSLLSAPLVGSVLSERDYEGSFRCTVNYWFRHIVEFFWPIYPGLILTQAITGMPLERVSLMQLPLGVLMAAIGLVVFGRKITMPPHLRNGLGASLRGIASGVWPIVSAILLYAVTSIHLAICVGLAYLAVVVVSRPTAASLTVSLRQGLSYKLLLLIFGTLSFQSMLEVSGAITSLSQLATTYHFPEELLIFLVLFVTGLLTGMVAAYVALGYSLLAPLLYQPDLMPGHILLAYCSGYLGMMLSPTHLCLILTAEYFGTDIVAVYRRIGPPLAILALLALGLYFSGWPGLAAG